MIWVIFWMIYGLIFIDEADWAKEVFVFEFDFIITVICEPEFDIIIWPRIFGGIEEAIFVWGHFDDIDDFGGEFHFIICFILEAIFDDGAEGKDDFGYGLDII